MNNYLVVRLIFFLAILFFFGSCKKEIVDTQTQSAVDLAFASQIFTDLIPSVFNYSNSKVELSEYRNDSVYNICVNSNLNIDTALFPEDTVYLSSLNYGSLGCFESNKRLKKGILWILSNGKMYWVGQTIKINFQDYEIDGVTIYGEVNLKYVGNNNFSIDSFNVNCNQSGLSFNMEGYGNLTVSMNKETPSIFNDDSYSISISGKSVDKYGKSSTFSTSSSLIYNGNCKWISEGIMKLKPTDLDERTLNFGAKTCDDAGIVVINGNDYSFKLF